MQAVAQGSRCNQTVNCAQGETVQARPGSDFAPNATGLYVNRQDMIGVVTLET